MITLLFVALFFVTTANGQYQPTWSSIDSRPLPSWYDDSKFGIFCHWGVYSVPAHRSEWIWWDWKGVNITEVVEYMDKHFHGKSYADLANEFTAEDFDPEKFASIVKASGARYFVLTSKHHEGFTLWPSKTSWNWNAVDLGPKRDLVGELKQSISKEGIHFGLYFSQYEWFNPLYMNDAEENTTDYVDQVSYPQMLEIVNNYGPEVVWSDGDWDQSDTYWKSKEFLAWLYNESPVKDTVVVNDRWGRDIMGKHGGFMTYADNFEPGHLMDRKWENCMTLDQNAWGYRRDMNSSDVYTVKELIGELVMTISCGGNFLLNIGPNKYGTIAPIFEDRLRQLGQFVNVHEEAIFGTKPWIHQNDTQIIWYTSSVKNSRALDPNRLFNPQNRDNTVIYAWVLEFPQSNFVELPSVTVTEDTNIQLLGTPLKLVGKQGPEGAMVDMSPVRWVDFPSKDAFILRIENAADSDHNPLE